jgi:hypothetical protein
MPWLVASCKSATNQPSGTEPRDVVVEDHELLDEEEAASEVDTSALVFVTVIYVAALEGASDR